LGAALAASLAVLPVAAASKPHRPAKVIAASAVPVLSTPQATIQRFYDTLTDAMKRGPQLGFNGRFQLLAPILDQTFDFRDMTEHAVGPSWASLSEAERSKVTAAFRKLSISTYAHEFKSYDGEQFKQIGEPKTGRLGGVLLRTSLTPSDGEVVALNYLLHQAAGGWKIYDVYLAGAVSEVARRRDEFSALLRDKGVAGMAAELDNKSSHLAAEESNG
jgi:phospholipid transport system substrate-binding protein